MLWLQQLLRLLTAVRHQTICCRNWCAFKTETLSAKWMEWNWRTYCFHFCPCVCVCPWALILRCKYLENSLRQRLGTNYPLIGNGLRQIEWWRHRWRHVTLKGQSRDRNIFKARYFENTPDRLSYNRAPIGNGMHGIEWSRDWWRPWPRKVKIMT